MLYVVGGHDMLLLQNVYVDELDGVTEK